MSWQPMIDAAAAILAFWLWPWMLALSWLVLLVGRGTFIRWMEALGWSGLREMLAGFGNSPSAMLQAHEQARQGVQAPANNITTLPR